MKCNSFKIVPLRTIQEKNCANWDNIIHHTCPKFLQHLVKTMQLDFYIESVYRLLIQSHPPLMEEGKGGVLLDFRNRLYIADINTIKSFVFSRIIFINAEILLEI